MGVRVKICGITNWADARRAVHLGADYLGFNFYPGSPRYVAPEKVRRILRRLQGRAIPVGVFVDAPVRQMREIARHTGLRVIQLHGSEPPRVVAALARDFTVWKAIRVRGKATLGRVRRFAPAQAILLDAYRRGAKGGTGQTFDWELARQAGKKARIVLAGGLTPQNVAEAIHRVRPFAVDVASGVERRAGKKDAGKMRAFLNATGKKA